MLLNNILLSHNSVHGAAAKIAPAFSTTCQPHPQPLPNLAQCKQLIRDIERVRWKVDPNGNSLSDLDKSDPKRSHLSDAVGYMIAREFSMRSQSVFRAERLI